MDPEVDDDNHREDVNCVVTYLIEYNFWTFIIKNVVVSINYLVRLSFCLSNRIFFFVRMTESEQVLESLCTIRIFKLHT